MGVRPVVVAPAHVEPHAVARDALDGLVEGVHVERDHLLEALEGLVLEEARPLHGEIRAVQLEDEAAGVDQRVLLPQLAGEGPDVPLVGVVVRVEQDRGGGAGRDRRHEALGEPPRVGGRRRQEQLALGLGLAEVGVLDLGDGLRRVADPGRGLAPRREQGGVVGVLDEVPRQPAPALPAEPAHPASHVGREPGPRLLAVVADVDPDGELPVDGPAHGRLGLPRELRSRRHPRRGPGGPAGPGARAGEAGCPRGS